MESSCQISDSSDFDTTDFSNCLGTRNVQFEEVDENTRTILIHICNISLAKKNGLWYILESCELMSQAMFLRSLKSGKIAIGGFSEDPNWPVVGDLAKSDMQNIQLFTQKILQETKEFVRQLDEIESFGNANSEKERSENLAELCFSWHPLLIFAMVSTDEVLSKRICDKKIWKQVWMMFLGDSGFLQGDSEYGHHLIQRCDKKEKAGRKIVERCRKLDMVTYLRATSFDKMRFVKEFSGKKLDGSLSSSFSKIQEKFGMIEGDELWLMEEDASKNLLVKTKLKIIRGEFVENGRNRDCLLWEVVDASYFST